MLLSVPNYVLPTAKQLWIISRLSSIDSIEVDVCVLARAYVCDYFFLLMWFELYYRKYLAFIFK